MAQKRRNSGQARKRKTQRKGGNGLPGWAWGLSGLAIGFFVALIINLELDTDSQEVDNLLDSDQGRNQASGEPEQERGGGETESDGSGQDDDKPEFEFYTVLPEQEVEVPSGEADSPDGETRSPDAPTGDGSVEPAPPDESDSTASEDASSPQEKGPFVLQAGSFQELSAADRMKAELALLGVEARIESASLDNGQTWHRVRAGPYTDRQRVTEIRRKLRSEEINTIILSRKD